MLVAETYPQDYFLGTIGFQKCCLNGNFHEIFEITRHKKNTHFLVSKFCDSITQKRRGGGVAEQHLCRSAKLGVFWCGYYLDG